jgi:type IV pilus assembly protein PilW
MAGRLPQAFATRHGLSYGSGFSLVEMMVAITIGLGLLAGLTTVLSGTSVNTRTNDRTSDLMTNGRYALNMMKQELRQAGFRGYTWAEPTLPAALGSLANECLETGAPAASFIANIRQGIWGANNSNPFSASCLPASAFADGNDLIVARRLAPEPVSSLVADTL